MKRTHRKGSTGDKKIEIDESPREESLREEGTGSEARGESPLKFFLFWFAIPLTVVILAVWLANNL